MNEAATQEGVADTQNQGMSDAEMLSSLTAMFDAQLPSDEPKAEQTAEEVEPTAEGVADGDSQEGDGETSQETEAAEDTEVEASDQSEDEGEESSDDGQWTPDSLDELAEALEMEPETVAETMKVKIKADGEESEATLKDVIKSYQLESTLNKRLEAHANERKAFEAQTTQLVETLQQRLQDVETTASAMEQLLFQDYQSVNWDELKNEDPTEYMLKQQEMRDRYASIEQVKNQLSEKQQADTQAQQQEQQKQIAAYLEHQKQALLEKVPEWSDQKQRETDLKSLQEYLRSTGASDQEIAQIDDHRVFLLGLKAMRYDQMHNKAEPKMKQMKTKPKFAKPGARKDPVKMSEKRKSEAFNRARKAQTDDAWTEALLAKLS